MGMFTKAVVKSAVAPARASKSTTWVVGDPAGDVVGKAVHELILLAAVEKTTDAKKKVYQTIVMKHAKSRHVADFCELGVAPDTPMKVQNSDGEAVTFVVQDRGAQYDVKPEQREVLSQLLGKDAVDGLLYTETTLGFDRTILGVPGVSEAIEKALEVTVKKLIKDGVLTGEMADELITAKQKTAFKPGTMDRAALLVGRDTTKLAAFLDAMGSSCCRYVKS